MLRFEIKQRFEMSSRTKPRHLVPAVADVSAENDVAGRFDSDVQ